MTKNAQYKGRGGAGAGAGQLLSSGQRIPRIFVVGMLIFFGMTLPSCAAASAPEHQQQQQQQRQQQYTTLDDNTIRNAVHDWVTQTNKEDVIATYGHISDWDTRYVTDMSFLFTHARFFNEDLSRWNTSSVTTFSYMFAFASSFRGGVNSNQDEGRDEDQDDVDNDGAFTLRNWHTSRVESMSFMFHHATAFEGSGLVEWDVRSVTDMTYMFQGADRFNHNIWRWDTSRVRSMNRMFHNATRFSQSLCWPLHSDMVAVQTFCGAAPGAGFQPSCDIEHVLQSDINRDLHDCCDCTYSADEHYAGYHMDDDAFWNSTGGDSSGLDQQAGIILTSVIWVLVFLTLAVVLYMALVRRQQVGDWLKSTLTKSSAQQEQPRQRRRRQRNGDNNTQSNFAPDGGVIATLIGLATTDGSTSHTGSSSGVGGESPRSLNNVNNNGDIINDESAVVVVGADHVQRQEEIEEVTAFSSPPWWIPQDLDSNNTTYDSTDWWLPQGTVEQCDNTSINNNTSTWIHASATTVEIPFDEPAEDISKQNGLSLMC